MFNQNSTDLMLTVIFFKLNVYVNILKLAFLNTVNVTYVF